TGRLPGKYHVAAGARSIEPVGISAARWAGAHLPQGTAIAADNINTLLLASYGHQHALADVSRGLELSPLFLTPSIQGWQRNILRTNHIPYLVVDRRTAGQTPPPDGFFYEPWELAAVPGAYNATKPVTAKVLMKYDRIPGAQRVFDDGSIVIYDVRALR